MPIGATISAVGAVGSAGIGYMGASKASKQQEAAAREAAAYQKEVYGEAKQNFEPYLNIGKNATYSLASLYGYNGANGANANGGKPDYSGFYDSPDYNFARDQGQRATQNVLSAQGNLLSGGGLAALNSFGQGLASQQYGNYFNRLMGLSGVGQNAANSLGQMATGQAQMVGNSLQSIGQAQASGTVGQTNALSGGVSGVANSLALPYFMQGARGSSYGSAPKALGSAGFGSGDSYSAGG